jgi:erythromycin esterase
MTIAPPLSILFMACLFGKADSQEVVQIGSSDETIYTFEKSAPNLYFDFFRSKAGFDDVLVFGMGEATHGTKEFFDIKRESFKYLVQNHGYRIFGIEDSFGGCSSINDYVDSGIGDIDSVLRHFDFWTWQTAEMKELVLWIKDFNAGRAQDDKVLFYGFDMQNFYTPIQYLSRSIGKLNIGNKEALQAIISPVVQHSELELYHKLQDKDQHYSDTLNQMHSLLEAWLNTNEEAIRTSSSSARFLTLQHCSDNFDQAVKNLSPGYNFRDSCMAANIHQIQQERKSKMFIWAHNGHINQSIVNNSVMRPMGGYLKDDYNEKYYAVGFTFSEGSFQAFKGPNTLYGTAYKYVFRRKHMYKGRMACTVPPSKRNTLTNSFDTTKEVAFFMDLSATDDPIFTTPQRTYDIGAVFMNYKRCSDRIIAKEQFNGMIHIRETTPAKPLVFNRN